MDRAAVAFAGAVLVLLTWLSVLRTAFNPRNPVSRATRWSFAVIGLAGNRLSRTLPGRLCARYLGLQAPSILFGMGICWLVANTAGFALLAWAAYRIPLQTVALGHFFQWRSGGVALAALAWLSTALLLAAFTSHLVRFADAGLRRERPVVRLAAQNRELPDAESLLSDRLRSGSKDDLNALFARWTDWFTDLGYSQVIHPGLVFVCSGSPLSWLEAGVIMLDAAALSQAVAPVWAPSSAQTLIDIGSRCLQQIAGQLGLQLHPGVVSLHGREERRFADTYEFVIGAGVPDERDERRAWASFQASRTQYAPYAAAISQQLNCTFNVTGPQPTSGLRITSDCR